MMDDEHMQGLRRRYLEMFTERPLTEQAMAATEAKLKVRLPNDFKSIARFFSGDLLGGVGNYRLDGTNSRINIADETLRIRLAVGLPNHFVVLAEPPESLIVLDVESGTVTWCGGHDVMNLADGKPLNGPVTEWPSYASYFKYLLDAEMEERE